MRIFLPACLIIAAAAPCHAQNGNLITAHIAEREIVVRDFVGSGQFTVEPDGTIQVPDYQFSAMLPERCRALIADIGGHVHGVVVTLGRECRAPASDRYIAVWADFNSTDAANALARMKELGACAKPAWAEGPWAAAIDGFRTALCRSEASDGWVEITLIAMGGAAPRPSATPFIDYRVTLTTTKASLEQDMALFWKFVCSIDSIDAGDGSTLCAEQVS